MLGAAGSEHEGVGFIIGVPHKVVYMFLICGLVSREIPLHVCIIYDSIACSSSKFIKCVP